MKHQQFEDWLISDEPLSPEEDRLLKEHLETCGDCQLLKMAFTEVEDVFKTAPMAAPPEGFVRRFDSRLEKRLKHERRIQSIVVFSISSLIAVASLILLLLSLDFSTFQAGDLFTTLVAFYSTITVYFTKMFDVGFTLLSVFLGAAGKVEWFNIIMVLISLIAFRISSTSLRTSRKGVSYE